jgi:hypothetical protein
MTGNFANNGNFHAIVGIFYMPQICDMESTALLPLQRKACWWLFRLEKSDGFGQVWNRELGTKDQHATSRPLFLFADFSM